MSLFICSISFLLVSSICLLEAAGASNLFHVPITRKSVPASRVYAFNRRPWFSQIPSSSTLRVEPAAPTSRDTATNPIHGSITPLGEYFLTLSFGGQPINVQMDTGSSTLAVPLKRCKNCRHGDHRLDLTKTSTPSSIVSCSSSTCRTNSCYGDCGACSAHGACCSKNLHSACSFSLTYADRSGVSGALVEADVGISTLVSTITFGAILEETTSFETEDVDGIFGLAYKSLACNPSCVTPLFDSLVESGQVKRDVFSVCMDQQGGMLTLGGSHSDMYEAPLQYAPLLQSYVPMFYLVALKGATIGGEKVDLPHFTNTIIDSGTTLVIISNPTYDALKEYFSTNYCNVPGLCVDKPHTKEIIRHPHYPHPDVDHMDAAPTNVSITGRETVRSISWFTPGYCVDFDEKDLNLLPTISIHLNGVTLDLESNVYMVPHYIQHGFTKKLYWCLGIAPLAGLAALPNDVIIGDTVLQKYFVEYDREKGRLGFAKSKKCIDPSAVEPASIVQPHSAAQSSSSNGGLASWLSYGFQIIIVVVVVIVVITIFSGLRSRSEQYEPITST